MQSDGYQAADEIFALFMALGGLGLSDVKMSCCEGQGWSYARDLLAEVQDAGAEGALSLITTHTYKGTPATPDKPLNTTLPVWVTEISPIMQRLGMTQTWYRNNSENEGLLNAVNIHQALTTGNVSAYVYWIGAGQSSAEAPFIWAPNLIQNVSNADMWHSYDNNTVIEVPPGTVPYTIGSTYWGSAQFSRFIRPGAKRVEVMQGGLSNYTALLTSAYRNKDGSVVVQAINNGDRNATVSASVPSLESSAGCQVETWVSDTNRKLELLDRIPYVSGVVDKILPQRSLTTFVVRCG